MHTNYSTVEKDDELTNLKGEIESLRIQLKATEDAKKEVIIARHCPSLRSSSLCAHNVKLLSCRLIVDDIALLWRIFTFSFYSFTVACTALC